MQAEREPGDEGPAEPSSQIAETATEGQAADANLRDKSQQGRQPTLLGRPVDVLE